MFTYKLHGQNGEDFVTIGKIELPTAVLFCNRVFLLDSITDEYREVVRVEHVRQLTQFAEPVAPVANLAPLVKDSEIPDKDDFI